MHGCIAIWHVCSALVSGEATNSSTYSRQCVPSFVLLAYGTNFVMSLKRLLPFTALAFAFLSQSRIPKVMAIVSSIVVALPTALVSVVTLAQRLIGRCLNLTAEEVSKLFPSR